MKNICLIHFAEKDRSPYLIGSQMTRTDPGYSPFLDLEYHQDKDAGRHAQRHALRDAPARASYTREVYYVVLKGELSFLIEGQQIQVKAGQIIGMRVGMDDQITGAQLPVEYFRICVPGAGSGNSMLPTKNQAETLSGRKSKDPVLVNLRQTFRDYPLGACLPENHENYSPWLDFTCVWGVDPIHAWKDDQRHFHTLREEYFLVLSGRLDFAIDSSILSVGAGQILGLKPTTIHQVIGGIGPVDVLFIRVPGGRGDKTII